MSELISDRAVESLEDWDAELPLPRGFEGMYMMGESGNVTFMVGGLMVVMSVVGEGVGGALPATDP